VVEVEVLEQVITQDQEELEVVVLVVLLVVDHQQRQEQLILVVVAEVLDMIHLHFQELQVLEEKV